MTPLPDHPDHIGHLHADDEQYQSHRRSEFPLEINGLKIDPLIFTQGFVERCDLGICSAECCWYGVYADRQERDLILSMKEQIAEVMDDSQRKDWEIWFEPEQEDADFPSGVCAGTEVHNNKCVFLDRNGFCSLQVLAMKHGKAPWAYKPYYCVLYPITVVDGVLTFDDHHAARLHYCGVREHFTHTIFEACTAELVYALGEEGYRELAGWYEANKERHLSLIDFR